MRASRDLPRRLIGDAREMLGIFGAIAVVAVVASVFAEPAAAPRQGLLGGTAPDFSAIDTSGTTIRLADLRGRPVWLEFFSSWCTNCREEDPDIQALHEEELARGGDLVVLGVGVGESVTSAAAYAANADLTFRIVADPGWSVARPYAVVATPTHVFVDRDGVIRAVHIGGLQPETMRALVAAITGGG